jgi:hypothetical protein
MALVTETTNVNFRAERDLLERYRQVVASEERTVSADLRHYMRRRVDESESLNKQEAASAPPPAAS